MYITEKSFIILSRIMSEKTYIQSYLKIVIHHFFLIVNGIYKDDQSSFIELAMLIYGCCRLNKILKKPI